MFQVAHSRLRVLKTPAVHIGGGVMRKSDIKARQRAAQLAYVGRLVETTGRTLSELAKAANLNHVTLTRFYNDPNYSGTLNGASVMALAAATGIPAPPEAYGGMQPPVGMGAGDAGGFREEAEPWDDEGLIEAGAHAALFAAAVAGRPHVTLWTLRSRALEEEGYRPGDVLVVDLSARARPGDVVCAQLYDWNHPGRTRTVFRLFQPPYLIGASREAGARTPRLLDDNVAIKGVVEAVLRLRDPVGESAA